MLLNFRGAIAATALLIASTTPAAAQQCAPFARAFSGIQLFGNASTWWNQADGRYARGNTPKEGAVLSFQATSHMRAGHVAVVSQVVSDRVLKITHANWSVINGSRGQVERDVEVVDVSPNNDWSQVKVWYAPIGKIGIRAYPTNGFIYKDSPRIQVASVDF
jgi:surface antigen